MPGTDIDIEIVFDRFIGRDETLDRLQSLLSDAAPEWSTDALALRDGGTPERVEIGSRHSLREKVLAIAGERGELYRTLVAEHAKVDDRLAGSCEIRGTTNDLIVIVSVDERPFKRLAGALLPGNRVTMQLTRKRVQGEPQHVWGLRALSELAEDCRPIWGRLSSIEEYDSKVMSSGQSIRAVGRDFAKYLPGLFTANFFGRPYVELIGADTLRDVPAQVAEVGEGLLVEMGSDPHDWNSDVRRTTEETVRTHIGPQYFFSKSEPAKDPVAPAWE